MGNSKATKKDVRLCPECGKVMDDWGIDTVKDDTGEHFLCYNEHYWECPDTWCDGSLSEMVGDSWNEPNVMPIQNSF